VPMMHMSLIWHRLLTRLTLSPSRLPDHNMVTTKRVVQHKTHAEYMSHFRGTISQNTYTQAVSCGFAMSFLPLTLSAARRARPSMMPSRPLGKISTGLGWGGLKSQRSSQHS
jgi:hypothetical protein